MRDFSPKNMTLDGASLFVTGATGSFGQAFVKRVLDSYKPRRLVVYSRDELKQYEMEQNKNWDRTELAYNAIVFAVAYTV